MKATPKGRGLLALTAATLAAAFSLSNAFWRQDNSLYDTLIAHWEYAPDPSLVLIAIDDRSLQALGQWPWPRSTHAQLLDRLTQADVKAVALDLVFSEPDLNTPENDTQLAAALRRNGRTILPVTMSNDSREMPQELLPLPPIASAAAQIAHTDIEVDADGISRGIYLRAGLGSPHWLAMAAALAGLSPPLPGLSLNTVPDEMPYHWYRDNFVNIRYSGPPASIPQVSYIDVLNEIVPADALRGRRVIVGITATGLGHRFLTPISRETWMGGAEYQANVASMLLGGHAITPLSQWQQTLVSALLALLAGIGMSTQARHRLWPWLALPATLPLVFLCCLALLFGFSRWFAPVACLAAVTLVWVGWLGISISRWRRQAQLDGLTGLANRHSFELAFRQELNAARRHGKPLTLIIIDVDHFKHYNDTLGHHAGDRALVLVAEAISHRARRAHDIAARFGGDEFAMILPEISHADSHRIAQALVTDISRLSVLGPDGPVPITATLGLHSAIPTAQTRPRDFFEKADAALYRAKAEGRNRYACSADDHAPAPNDRHAQLAG